jgi:DNA primase
VLEEFQIGFAPAAGDKLIQQAAKAGFSAQDLVAAGLARRRGGRVVDAFRGRIIFPLADYRGKVVGFAGRAMRDGDRPKYLNTSENQFFSKRDLLYGLDKARVSAMKNGRFVVVEGYTDVLALRQAGLTDSVAIMGTSLTDNQLKELAKVQGSIYLALDADNAGKNATSRASKMAGERNADLRIIAMPSGRDPADIVTQDGAEAFRGLLESAANVWSFQLGRHFEQADLSSGEGKQRAFEPALAIIRDAPPLVRPDLIRAMENALAVPRPMIEDALSSIRRSDAAVPDQATQRPAPPVRPISQVERAERVFLSLCLGLGERGMEYLRRSTPEHFSTDLMREARQHFLTQTGDPLAGLGDRDKSLASAVMEMVQMADEGGDVAEQALRLSYLQLELRRVERDLRSAEQRSDFERQRQLWGARESVRGEISELMGQTA